MLHVKKMYLVTLIALVIIKLTAQTERKSEEIGIVVSAAERFVGLGDSGILQKELWR